MELRNSVEFLKRRKIFIITVTVIVALLAGIASLLQAPVYKATARVLLHPDDPAEQLNDPNISSQLLDPDRYVSSQMDIVNSESVAAAAAKDLASGTPWKGLTPKDVQHLASVTQDGASDVLKISAVDRDPKKAAAAANSVARAYQENRRLHAVAGLQRADDEVSGRLRDLQANIADLDAKIAAAKASDKDSNALASARTAASEQYQSLYGKQQELLVNMSLKRGEAELVAAAKAPTAPSNHKPLRSIAIGGLVGLLLGVGGALLIDQLDDRLRSRDDVEKRNEISVLAELPYETDPATPGREVATLTRPLGPLAEAVRSLRSVLLFLDNGRRRSRLLVTSPGPAEGKSMVAANLAASYAQAGFRTILVSADLRRPTVEEVFGIPRETEGLTELVTRLSGPRWTPFRLENEAPATGNGHGNGNGNGHGNGHGHDNGNGHTPETAEPNRSGVLWAGLRAVFTPSSGSHVDASLPVAPAAPVEVAAEPVVEESTEARDAVRAALVPTELPDLWVLAAGGPTENPAELLGSRRAAELLDELQKLADIVIIDSPPVLPVTDASVLAPRTDGVILVNSLEQTHAAAARRAKEILETTNAPLIGVVINKVRRRNTYGYGYGYYGYYGSEGHEHTRIGSLLPKSWAPRVGQMMKTGSNPSE